jgi:hypothetical protein
LLGLAEYYAKVPKAQRRRTFVFVGLDGHHNDAGVGRMWMVAHKDELFAQTAVAINAEHTSTLQTYFYGENIRKTKHVHRAVVVRRRSVASQAAGLR